jgi:hypothetical protein
MCTICAPEREVSWWGRGYDMFLFGRRGGGIEWLVHSVNAMKVCDFAVDFENVVKCVSGVK